MCFYVQACVHACVPVGVHDLKEKGEEGLTATAFCSNHDITMESGRLLMSVSKACDSACATLMADNTSLHCPMSIRRGRLVPGMRPNLSISLLKRYLPQARVRTTASW